MSEPLCKCFSPANHSPDCDWLVWKNAGKPIIKAPGLREVLLDDINIPEWQLGPGRTGIFQQLVYSIRDSGLLMPVRLRQLTDGTYEIIDGLQRIKAYQELNKSSIMAMVL